MEKWTKFTKTLQDILENQDHFDDGSTPFEESDRLSMMNGLSFALPPDEIERALILFSRINMLFTAGFFFQREDSGRWSLVAVFEKGLAKPATEEITMDFPEQGLEEILRADAAGFLQKTGCRISEPVDGLSALLLRPARDFRFVLMSRRADPWLKIYSEKVLKALLDGLAQ